MSEELNVRITGTIKVGRDPSLTQEHNTERREDAASETKKYRVEIATLVVVIIYAGLTFWQGWLTRDIARTSQLQARAAQEQSEISHLQMRSFVQVTPPEVEKLELSDLKTFDFLFYIQNVGKVAATKIHMDMNVELPMTHEAPSFNYNQRHLANEPAPLYPGTTPRRAHAMLLKPGQFIEPEEMNDALRKELKDGERYLAVYGRIGYEDRFGIWWTQFCVWQHFSENISVSGFEAKGCMNYNEEG